MSDLRYPIGRFAPPATFAPDLRAGFIQDITALPAALSGAVRPLTTAQRGTPYRDGGWTVSQVVHHLADSHLNAYMRFRLALTEDAPTIKPYDEGRWAELPDATSADVGHSLALLEALHARWAALLKTLREDDFMRTYVHPTNGVTTLDRQLALYAWHGRHHLAHITQLRERRGW